MNNPFPYSYADKRYHTLNYHLREKYNQKIFKVMINAGFTCPNIDGTVKYGGCTFCSTKGSGDFAGNPEDNLKTQFNQVKEMMHQKWPEAGYIAYFQAFSNTHAPLEVLKRKYEAVLECDPNIVALSIGTRPDCLPDDVVDYLGELNKEVDLWVELGLQSMHDKTGKRINRGHDYQTLVEGVNKLRAKNIDVIIHIINGLPYETKEMMIDTIKYLSDLDIQGIKIHALSILKNTELASLYEKEKFKVLSRDEYIDIVVEQLEYLREDIVVNRITGDPAVEDLIEPSWLIKKTTILNDIDKLMKQKDTYQGIMYKKKDE